ncbi:glycoprotein precursor [Silverwater virus]|uniref:Envelopment polyprotein n=1 Tax=Silverwater virus TaxID=1564099 RepID=A0A097SRV7_9VIRU|nr:glycoprotein precursor [Silverwater virus]AIU95029.1 glycoprotein precursor [Silverwater virus]
MLKLEILVVMLCATLASALIADLFQHLQRAVHSEKKKFLQSQPKTHELIKGVVEVPSGLDASLIGFVETQNYTDRLTDGVDREMDCSGGRKTFLALDPGQRKLSNLSCGTGKVLSRDCSYCATGSPPVLNPPHKVIMYDDMICQFESDATSRLKQPQGTYCSVGGVKVKDCSGLIENTVEKITWVLLKEKIIFLEGHSLSWREGPWFSLFDCKNTTETTDPCDINVCKAGKCTGDAIYCSQFSCEKSSPECKCTRNLVPGILHVTIGDNTVVPKCFGHSKWVVQRQRKLLSVQVAKSCLDCSVECRVGALHVVVRHFDPGYYQVCLGPVCYTGEASSKEFDIPIHPMSRISTEEVSLQLWSSTKTDRYDLQTSCHHLSACDLINCFFCKANWVNVHCFRREKWIIIAIVLSITCVCVGMVLKAVQRIVSFLAWMLGPVLWFVRVICRCSGKKLFMKAQKARLVLQELDEESQSLIQLPETHIAVPSSPNKGSRTARKNKVLLMVSLISIMTPVQSCSDSVKLISLAKDCTQVEANRYSCSFSSTALIPVAPIGQTSCILLTSQSGETLGVMKLKTIEAKLSCLKSDLYWIPRATHQCYGARRCRLAASCTGENCMKMTENDFSAEWGSRETIMNRLGWSSCNPQCGGIGCGCFNVNPSCFYLRKTFTNQESLVFKAFECSSWTHSVQIKVSFNDTDSTLFLQPDSPQKMKWGKVQLASISTAPNVGFSECFFEAQNGDIFHSPCNRRGEVSLGKLGEIQCPTSSDAMQISPSCFSDQSIINHLINKDVVHCTSQLVDPKEIMKKNKLPATIGGTIFYPGKSSVYASSSSRVSATMLVKLNDVHMFSLSDRNKCSSRFLNLTGCYNCEAGAILRMESVTDFGTADAILECPTIGLLSYFISTASLSITETIIHLNKSKINVECTVTCPNSVEKLTIYGELAYLKDLDFRHHNETTTPIVQRNDGGIDWFGWLHFGWMQWVWAIVGVGLTIVGVVIGFFLLRFLCSKMKIL